MPIESNNVLAKFWTADAVRYSERLKYSEIILCIDISGLILKLCNGNTVKILNYSGSAEIIGSNSLFEHTIWNNFTDNNFGSVIIHDKDKSLEDYNTINDNTDMIYIIIKLSEKLSMNKGETMIITFYPSPGIKKTITLEAPLPIKQICCLN